MKQTFQLKAIRSDEQGFDSFVCNMLSVLPRLNIGERVSISVKVFTQDGGNYAPELSGILKGMYGDALNGVVVEGIKDARPRIGFHFHFK